MNDSKICITVPMDTRVEDVKEVAVKEFKECGFFVEIGDLFIDNTNTVNPYDWTVCSDYYARRYTTVTVS